MSTADLHSSTAAARYAAALTSASAATASLGPAASANSRAAQKLRKAAGEFESMLLANLWKSMKGTFASRDDQSDDPGHETLDEMGIQAMSSAVGKAGGLGLGKLIIKHLEPLIPTAQKGTPSQHAAKASALPADTFLEGHRGAPPDD